jgi:hypothetical protein
VFIKLGWVKVKLSHDTSVRMITVAMVTLVEHHKAKISDFNVPSSQTIEEHLSNHHNDSRFFE